MSQDSAEYDSYKPKSIGKKTKKFVKASKSKRVVENPEKQEAHQETQRLVPYGVSVFDLIMPWKNEIVDKESKNLIEKGFAKVVNKIPHVENIDLANHANDVQAILINPPWECCQTPANDQKSKKTISIESFKKLDIPKTVLKDGLVFIWIEKEIISDVIHYMEKQDIQYVENVCYVMLDQNQKQGKYFHHFYHFHFCLGIDNTRQIDISDSYVREQSSYLYKSKKTLLIFRRVSDKKAKCNLELRHQRTCDVCFDWAITNPGNEYSDTDKINKDGLDRYSHFKPNNYIYKMIETMLPKAMVTEEKRHLRLLELWSQNDEARKGWIKIC